MNAKQFNDKIKALYTSYGVGFDDNLRAEIKTPFGVVYLSAEWSPRIKVANIHSRIIGDIDGIRKETFYGFNPLNGKFNRYYSDPSECIVDFDEYIYLLLLLSANDTQKEALKTVYENTVV